MTASALDHRAHSCSHAEVELLGYNRDAVFLRCPTCGAIFVKQGGRLWKLPPAAPTKSSALG